MVSRYTRLIYFKKKKKEQSGEQMNITGVFLHILADALGKKSELFTISNFLRNFQPTVPIVDKFENNY